MLDYDSLRKKDSIPYQSSVLKRCLIIIRNSNSDKSVSESYKTLIFMHKDIILKNIHNIRNFKGCEFSALTPDDLMSESFIVLKSCIKNYGRLNRTIQKRDGQYDDENIEYTYKVSTKFYWYYNTALRRKFLRLYKKEIKEDFIEYQDEIKKSHLTTKNSGQDFTIKDLKRMGLTPIQRLIVLFRINVKNSVKDFVEQTNMTQETYYWHLKQIKDKIQKTEDYESKFFDK